MSSRAIALYHKNITALRLKYDSLFKTHIMSHSAKLQNRQSGSETRLIATLRDQVSLCVINGCCQPPTHTTLLHCINLKRHWVILGNVVLFILYFFSLLLLTLLED